MATEVQISDVKVADDSELRSMNVTLGSHTITTPVKSVINRDFYKDTRFPQKLSKLKEVFLKFDETSLDLFAKDLKYSNTIHKKVEKAKKLVVGCDALSIIEFRNMDGPPRYPNEEEIKALVNSAYSFSDITLIPSIPKTTRNITVDNFEEFTNYLSKCYEGIKIRNKKKIMGYIPTIPQFFIDDIVDFYIDRGINSYYIDFDGTMVTSHLTMINALKRRLAERGYEENNFIYYINISYGKAINEQEILSARDILAFGHGLDGLGGIHTGPKRNKGFYDWLKTQKNVTENAIRLFNKGDYGYYRINSPDIKLDEIYPFDALYSKKGLQTTSISELKRMSNIINLQQQSIESINLENLIKEKPDKTIDYFATKEMVSKEDIKRLSKR